MLKKYIKENNLENYKQENEYKNKKIHNHIIEFLGVIFGAFLIAVGTSLFLLPNQLSTGGFAGIATVIYYIFDIQMGTTILLLNIPLFLFSIFKLGKSFFIKSIIGTISLSFFIDLLDKYPAITNDGFLACIYGGIIIGVGTAIILKVNASTGGTDLLSFIIRKYKPNIRNANIIVITDIIIVGLNMIFLQEIEIGLYSAVAIYVMGKMLDIIFEGVYFTKLLIIISDQNEKISQEIGDKIKRGSTGLLGKGMYTNKEKLVLLCAASRTDISKIKYICKNIDKNAFIIISNAREVIGLGFK